MTTLVMKFGGTSTGDVKAINRAADIVIAQNDKWDRIVVVVSAMAGVTNMLIECADRALLKDNGSYRVIIEELRNKLDVVVWAIFNGDQVYEQLEDLIDTRIEELSDICQRIHHQGKTSAQDMDEVAALGERINVHVFSSLLRKRDVLCQAIETTKLIVTDDSFQAASPNQTATDACVEAELSPLFEKGFVPVVTGFIGATPNGATTTLGRGGSDYTAAILGKSLNADEVWIWTDVDGVMTADPSLTPEARVIPEISYNEVYELANFGAKVIHPKTILPVREANIPLWVKNTFNPQSQGTRISHYPRSVKYGISAVTGLVKVNLITFRIKSDDDFSIIKAHILDALTELGIGALAIFQASLERSVSFAFHEEISKQTIQAFKEDLSFRLPGGYFSRIHATDNLTIVTAVGREIYNAPQVLSKAANALDRAGVEVSLIGHGSSPDSLTFLVADKDGEHAIRQIHDEVILNEMPISQESQPVR